MPVTHPRLHRALLRGVRFAREEGVFIVQIGRFRGQIEIEDTPFWVVAYDPARGEVQLSDGSCEPLCVEGLSLDPDGVLRLRLKGGFPARFSHAGQAHLLDAVEATEGRLALQVGRERVPLPQLEG